MSKTIGKCKVLHSYKAQKKLDISVTAGDVLEIVNDEGLWWLCKFESEEGYVPSNYVERIKEKTNKFEYPEDLVECYANLMKKHYYIAADGVKAQILEFLKTSGVSAADVLATAEQRKNEKKYLQAVLFYHTTLDRFVMCPESAQVKQDNIFNGLSVAFMEMGKTSVILTKRILCDYEVPFVTQLKNMERVDKDLAGLYGSWCSVHIRQCEKVIAEGSKSG